jgi:hypothetical protein
MSIHHRDTEAQRDFNIIIILHPFLFFSVSLCLCGEFSFVWAILFLHFFQQLIETVIRIIDTFFHTALEHTVTVCDRLEDRLRH